MIFDTYPDGRVDVPCLIPKNRLRNMEKIDEAPVIGEGHTVVIFGLEGSKTGSLRDVKKTLKFNGQSGVVIGIPSSGKFYVQIQSGDIAKEIEVKAINVKRLMSTSAGIKVGQRISFTDEHRHKYIGEITAVRPNGVGVTVKYIQGGGGSDTMVLDEEKLLFTDNYGNSGLQFDWHFAQVMSNTGRPEDVLKEGSRVTVIKSFKARNYGLERLIVKRGLTGRVVEIADETTVVGKRKVWFDFDGLDPRVLVSEKHFPKLDFKLPLAPGWSEIQQNSCTSEVYYWNNSKQEAKFERPLDPMILELMEYEASSSNEVLKEQLSEPLPNKLQHLPRISRSRSDPTGTGPAGPMSPTIVDVEWGTPNMGRQLSADAVIADTDLDQVAKESGMNRAFLNSAAGSAAYRSFVDTLITNRFFQGYEPGTRSYKDRIATAQQQFITSPRLERRTTVV